MAVNGQRRRALRRFLIPVLSVALAGFVLLAAIVLADPLGTTAGITHARGATMISRPYLHAHAAQTGVELDGLHAVWTDPSLVPALGGSGAVVAVVDSGADLDHGSLAQHLWTNPGEVPGNGLDDDHNGYVDDTHGVNILAPGSPPDDGYGHGTAVAGLIAASDSQATGVNGAAPGARLMIVRVLGDDGEGDTEQLAAGIAYAVRNGASVINCSVNSEFDSPAVDTAIAAANDAGIVIVAAAGNDGLNLDDNTQTYPASTDSAAVVSVAATQTRGLLAGFSNYGPSSVDLAAPGVDLVTTYTGDSFTTLSGTSASAPLVSAALASEQTAQPQATLPQVRAALMAGATRGVAVINGELDASAAMDSIDGGAQADRVVPTLSVASTFTRRGTRIVVRARWSLKTRLVVPLGVLLRVRSGSARGRVLSTRRVVLRGMRGTIAAAPVSRPRRGPARFWLDVRTTGSVSAASVQLSARISSR